MLFSRLLLLKLPTSLTISKSISYLKSTLCRVECKSASVGQWKNAIHTRGKDSKKNCGTVKSVMVALDQGRLRSLSGMAQLCNVGDVVVSKQCIALFFFTKNVNFNKTDRQ